MEAARESSVKTFQTLSGYDVLVVPATMELCRCRDLLARRLNVRPEMLHLVEQEADALYSAVVCATFKVLCIGCQKRIECACEEEEVTCQCILSQNLDLAVPEDDLCFQCHEELFLKVHWCSSSYCTVCRDDWQWPSAPLQPRRCAKKKHAKRAPPEMPWECESERV